MEHVEPMEKDAEGYIVITGLLGLGRRNLGKTEGEKGRGPRNARMPETPV